MSFSTPEDGRLTLWPERRIETDQAKARRVYQSLDKKLGAEGKRLVVQGFLTCLEEKELHLWRFLRLGYQLGPGFTRGLADERVAAVWKAVQHLTGEAHLLKGFTRFSEIDGVLVGRLNPRTGCSPCCGPTSAPATPARTSSSTTAPTRRFCSTGRETGPSCRRRTSAPARRGRRSGSTAGCGGGSTTPSPSRAGTTPGAA